jgi:hypothetical protein
MFKLKLWIRRFWREHFGEAPWSYGKNSRYMEEFPWLVPLVPLRGSVHDVKIRRVSLGVLFGSAYGGWPRSGRDFYLCDARGRVLGSAWHRAPIFTLRWKFCMYKHEAVYDVLMDLGGYANVVKYVVEVDWCRDQWPLCDGEFKEKRSRHASITIYKFPAGVIPSDFATTLVRQFEAERKADDERRRLENIEARAKQQKVVTDQFKAELVAVAD